MSFSFGFKRNNSNTSKPNTQSANLGGQQTNLDQSHLPEQSHLIDQLESDELVLISREDIYSDHGRGVLLLKEGRKIHPRLLPSLIKCGVDPNQFYIEGPVDGDDDNQFQLRRHQQHVIVLDPQQKSIKRTMDILVDCGYSLGRIHPVRLPLYLGWALDKYQPHLLVMDYHLANGLNAYSLLIEQLAAGLRDTVPHTLEKIIITMPVGVLAEQPRLMSSFDQIQLPHVDIQIAYKPIQAESIKALVDDDLLIQ